MQNGSHLFERTLPLFLAMITAIVVVFIAQLNLDMKKEIGELRQALSTVQAETAAGPAVEPFGILEEKCTDCHAERRFTQVHGTSADIAHVMKFMESMPDVDLSEKDVQKIHGSLQLLACAQCHDEQTIKEVAALSPDRQRAIIERMASKPGSGISLDDVSDMQRAFQAIQGF